MRENNERKRPKKKEEKVTKNRAARHSCNYARANVKSDKEILAEFERYTLLAGLIMGAFFGFLIGWGF